MTRDAFLEGFTERLRHVLQKFARELDDRRIARECPGGGSQQMLGASEFLTDAAIDELARYLCDAFLQAQAGTL